MISFLTSHQVPVEFDIFFVLQLIAIGDYARLVHTMNPIVFLSFWFYLFCDSGNQLMHRFENVADDVFMDVNWYLMPTQMQKCVPMMIAAGQKKVYLQGFAGTRCTREVFMKVRSSNCFNQKRNIYSLNNFDFRSWNQLSRTSLYWGRLSFNSRFKRKTGSLIFEKEDNGMF